MNWRNPFLNVYLAVTVLGAGALGYFAYSAYNHYVEVATDYDSQVAKLQSLQNRNPFPSDENNQAYTALTTQYRTEYEKLLARVTKMQRPLEAITPQTFQDRLRTYVTEVVTAAKANNVIVDEPFYLGFEQYRDNLPSNEAAPALARELDAIRLIADQLVTFKVKEIKGIKRQPLPEEGGSRQAEPVAASSGRPGPGANVGRPGGNNANSGPKIISANSFDVGFIADQGRLRQVLNAIVTANQFFIIRSLNIENSSLEGPKRVDPNAANPTATTPAADPAAPANSMRLLVGRETVTTVLRLETLTFNPPASQK